MISLQKAHFGKRIVAAIFDGILVVILATGLLALFATLSNTDKYITTAEAAKTKYAEQYGVDASVDKEKYDGFTDEQKAEYEEAIKAADKAFAEDKDAVYAYNMFINLSLIGVTLSILFSIIVVEFVVPLAFDNGQTLGKKIFGIALMHIDGIKVSKPQLFVRALLGKFTIEVMLPVYILMMIYFNTVGITIIVLPIILIVEVICLIITKTNAVIHDVLAKTVAVDMASQRIFDSREELIEYTKKLHAEQANKPMY